MSQLFITWRKRSIHSLQLLDRFLCISIRVFFLLSLPLSLFVTYQRNNEKIKSAINRGAKTDVYNTIGTNNSIVLEE